MVSTNLKARVLVKQILGKRQRLLLEHQLPDSGKRIGEIGDPDDVPVAVVVAGAALGVAACVLDAVANCKAFS